MIKTSHTLRMLLLAATIPCAPLLSAQTPATNSTPSTATAKSLSGKNSMTLHAKGTFHVKIGPLEAYNKNEGAIAGRMSIDKEFQGDLEAISRGEMLTAGTATKGSAGYVAIERVTGSLGGKTGSFALQHSGTMNRGVPQLSVTVVPDSGTGMLTGITGKMNIIIAEGKHSYAFDYSFAADP